MQVCLSQSPSPTSARLQGSGGVCDDCANGTIGVTCETCGSGLRAENVTAPPSMSPTAAEFACVPCNCDVRGTVPDTTCSVPTGQCQCVENVTGGKCDRCIDGFFGLETGGCVPCGCDVSGVVGDPGVGDVITCGTHTSALPSTSDGGNATGVPMSISGVAPHGQCECKPTRTGRQCAECADGYGSCSV